MRTPALLLCLGLLACENTGPALTPDFLDPNRTMEADPTHRTWENPDVEMNDNERADFETLCVAISQADATNGAEGADKGTYGELRVYSKWGKEMRRQLDRDGRYPFAPPFARVLKEESLDRSSPACEGVVQRWLGK